MESVANVFWWFLSLSFLLFVRSYSHSQLAQTGSCPILLHVTTEASSIKLFSYCVSCSGSKQRVSDFEDSWSIKVPLSATVLLAERAQVAPFTGNVRIFWRRLGLLSTLARFLLPGWVNPACSCLDKWRNFGTLRHVNYLHAIFKGLEI